MQFYTYNNYTLFTTKQANLMKSNSALHLNLHHAISQQLLVAFRYNDQDDWRVVEPFCLGLSSANNWSLRAFQRSGPSGSKTDWKLFNLDKAQDLRVLSQQFTADLRKKYRIGDKHMQTIFRQLY